MRSSLRILNPAFYWKVRMYSLTKLSSYQTGVRSGVHFQMHAARSAPLRPPFTELHAQLVYSYGGNMPKLARIHFKKLQFLLVCKSLLSCEYLILPELSVPYILVNDRLRFSLLLCSCISL